MKKIIIDPFKKRFSNEQAQKFFEQYIRFNKNDELVYGKHLLIMEKRLENLFFLLRKYHFAPELEYAIPIKFSKERLTRIEYKLWKMYRVFLKKKHTYLYSFSEILFLVKICSREIATISFISEKIKVKIVDEFCLVVECSDENIYGEIKKICKEIRLYIRLD